MRQRGDSAFAELLCRVRTGDYTREDLDVLKSRERTVDIPNYLTHALHVYYRMNEDVKSRNNLMLNNLASESEQYAIRAKDAVAGQTTHIDLSTLPDKRSETGGLEPVLKVAIGARVMLTHNVPIICMPHPLPYGRRQGTSGDLISIFSPRGREIDHE